MRPKSGQVDHFHRKGINATVPSISLLEFYKFSGSVLRGKDSGLNWEEKVFQLPHKVRMLSMMYLKAWLMSVRR